MVGLKTLLFVLSLPIRRTVVAVGGPILGLGIKAVSLLALAVLAGYLAVADWLDTLRHRAGSRR